MTTFLSKIWIYVISLSYQYIMSCYRLRSLGLIEHTLLMKKPS
jgi:hypothetical protein